MRSTLSVINDILFSYSFMSLLVYFWSSNLEVYQASIYGFVLTVLLTYLEPFDNLARKISIWKIIKMGGKPRQVFEISFNTSYLQALRIKFKTSFYITIILAEILFLNTLNSYHIPILFIVIVIIAILGIQLKVFRVYYPNIIYGISAVSGYIAAIRGKSITYELNERLSFYERIKDALENENWFEAFNLLAVIGIPGNVTIPKEVLTRAWEYS